MVPTSVFVIASLMVKPAIEMTMKSEPRRFGESGKGRSGDSVLAQTYGPERAKATDSIVE